VPEGDTIHRLARAIGPGLVGQRVRELELRHRGQVDVVRDQPIREVAALGKHQLLPIGERWVLHVHLGIRGRWQRLVPGAEWPRARSRMWLRLQTDDEEHVCFDALISELSRRIELAGHPQLLRLGPDLLAASFDPAAIVKRARAGSGAISELLLDQNVACGIGNVYKSEVLFIERVHPRTPIAALDDAALATVYTTSRRLMRQNLGPWRRTTVRRVARDSLPRRGEIRLFVYGRAGQPCLACGARICSARLGDAARPTYWCPHCQPDPG
jgi:endonuclease-8